MQSKWPKTPPPLTEEQQKISNDFMRYWHEVLPKRFGLVEKFNHSYPVKHAPTSFERTLEIGAGLGEHLNYEQLTPAQQSNYIALELRQNMAEQIAQRFPNIKIWVGDCQKPLDFPDHYFDRILAIHVLEHLPDLPSTIREMHRLCNKQKGIFSIVIPCEGGMAYSLARKISAQRIFEKRYQQSYRWFYQREHLNQPHEILAELKPYFQIQHRAFFPLGIPLTEFNLCIGLTLKAL